MKHSRSRDLMLQMDRLVQLIQDSLNEELAQVLFHYLLNGSEHVTVTFLQTLAQRLPQHEDNIMTLAERIGKRKLTAVCSHQTRIGNLDAHLI